MKALVFQSKRLSYDSSWCFMEMVRRALVRLGHEVVVFSLAEDIESQQEELEELSIHSFDAVFDVNSLLPFLRSDEGVLYLNRFDAPFFHLIVDHPMHVHLSLQAPVRRHCVICLDRCHKEYLEQNYPQLEAVLYMPFGGIAAEDFSGLLMRPEGEGMDAFAPVPERIYDILFPATYTPLAYYRERMEIEDPDYVIIADEILKEYRKGSLRPVDELFFEKSGSDEEFFSLKMHRARHIDRYIRQWYRDFILGNLLEAGLVIDVTGFRWELYDGPGKENLRIHPPSRYPDQLRMLSESRLTLNVQPLFLDGMHDRIPNAMMNGSVILSDTCRYQQEHFISERDGLFFDKNHPEEIVPVIRRLLEAPDQLQEMAEHGKQKAREAHTWYHRIEVLLGDYFGGDTC